MEQALGALIDYGYWILVVWVALDQLGLPIPAVPALLGAGALAAEGQLDLALAIGLAAAACMPSDLLLYTLGRRYGGPFLAWLCRLSIEPDSCVRKSQARLDENGALTLVVAKFVPGLTLMAPPLAGLVRMPLGRFVLLDGAAALIYAGGFIALGWAFAPLIEQLATWASQAAGGLLGVGLLALAVYLSLRFVRRWRMIRTLRGRRLHPDHLLERLRAAEGGELSFLIVDLRTRADAEREPRRIPGAWRVEVDRMLDGDAELPRDRDIILYCT